MGFEKGRRKTGGRKVGSLNKATFAIQEVCRQQGPIMISRLIDLVKSRDGHISIKAMKILLNYGFGRPSESIQLSGIDAASSSPHVVFYLPYNPRHKPA